jgi:dTDP-4-dehydrorhamnose 3,5-epimerase
MGNFKFEEQKIKGIFLIEPKVFGDERGYFMETYHQEDFRAAGIDRSFVQQNQSMSRKNVLRGLHFQKEHPQGKLVRVLKGEVFDVAVDLRSNSPTYGQWCGAVLSGNNKKMLYVPEGFAHGFLVLSEEAEFTYLCTDFYHPEDEGGIRWNDPEVGIDWPLENGVQPLISEKDKKHPSLKQSGIKF